MLKKVVLGALFLGLAAILIVGAVNRTAAKSGDDAYTYEARGQGQGLARQQSDGTYVTNSQGQGRNRQSVVEGQPASGRQQSASEQSFGAQGQGQGGNGQSGAPKTELATSGGGGQGNRNGPSAVRAAVDWIVMEGTVTSVDDETLAIQTAEGEIEIADRGWRFAREQGFTAQLGDRVQLTGFYEEGELEIGDLLNLTSQEQVQIREQGGRPLWAGGAGSNQEARGDIQLGQPIAETEDHEWMTLQGTVVTVDAEQMTVQTDIGLVEITDRPWDFALGQGFSAQVGDQVTLVGFDEEGTFEVGRLINGDQETAIREQSGRPLWAGGSGRGRQS